MFWHKVGGSGSTLKDLALLGPSDSSAFCLWLWFPDNVRLRASPGLSRPMMPSCGMVWAQRLSVFPSVFILVNGGRQVMGRKRVFQGWVVRMNSLCPGRLSSLHFQTSSIVKAHVQSYHPWIHGDDLFETLHLLDILSWSSSLVK